MAFVIPESLSELVPNLTVETFRVTLSEPERMVKLLGKIDCASTNQGFWDEAMKIREIGPEDEAEMVSIGWDGDIKSLDFANGIAGKLKLKEPTIQQVVLFAKLHSSESLKNTLIFPIRPRISSGAAEPSDLVVSLGGMVVPGGLRQSISLVGTVQPWRGGTKKSNCWDIGKLRFVYARPIPAAEESSSPAPKGREATVAVA